MVATILSTKRRLALVLAAALVAYVGGSGSAARAGSDDDEMPDVRILRSILSGLGLKRGDEPDIYYRERSPLVVPANTDLPPPETTPPEARNPDWPVEPEERQARLAAKRHGAAQDAIDSDEVMRPLPPDKLNVPQPTRSRDSGRPWKSAEDSARPMSPTALGYVGGLFGSLFAKEKDEQKKFTNEPERTSLTEPPPGYQTPSPNQPYGLGKGWNYEKPKAMDPMDQPVGGPQ